MEASTALSLPVMTTWQRGGPQAIRKIIPSLGNYVISMAKEVPFLLFISVPEMVAQAKDIGGATYRYLEPFTICGLIYLAFSYRVSVLRGNWRSALKSPEDDPVSGASTDRPFIHFDKVVKRYGDHAFLDNLDIDIAAGEKVP